MKLSLFYKYKNLITLCYFSNKEGAFNNGMNPFDGNILMDSTKI